MSETRRKSGATPGDTSKWLVRAWTTLAAWLLHRVVDHPGPTTGGPSSWLWSRLSMGRAGLDALQQSCSLTRKVLRHGLSRRAVRGSKSGVERAVVSHVLRATTRFGMEGLLPRPRRTQAGIFSNFKKAKSMHDDGGCGVLGFLPKLDSLTEQVRRIWLFGVSKTHQMVKCRVCSDPGGGDQVGMTRSPRYRTAGD